MASYQLDESNLNGLDQLLKAFKGKKPICKIGVLSASARHGKKGKQTSATNAEIGAVHEFGAPGRNIPQRSFLRVPLTDNLQKEMENAGIFHEEQVKKAIELGSLTPWLETIAVIAQGVVMDAFETSGNGKWPSWKDPEYTNEGGMLLVDSQQLRNSISFEVKEGG